MSQQSTHHNKHTKEVSPQSISEQNTSTQKQQAADWQGMPLVRRTVQCPLELYAGLRIRDSPHPSALVMEALDAWLRYNWSGEYHTMMLLGRAHSGTWFVLEYSIMRDVQVVCTCLGKSKAQDCLIEARIIDDII
jgi:hypothetical protein